MTQPCKNFKRCRGYAYDRKAKLCPKCWKLKLEAMRLTHNLTDVGYDDKEIDFRFEKKLTETGEDD